MSACKVDVVFRKVQGKAPGILKYFLTGDWSRTLYSGTRSVGSPQDLLKLELEQQRSAGHSIDSIVKLNFVVMQREKDGLWRE